MEINEKILQIFKEFNIKSEDGICYLISLFFGYKPSYIPDDLKLKINSTGIVKEEKGSLNWTVPLFGNQETAFEWVKIEYVALFKEANPAKGRYVREAISRMKKLFSENPEIRKDDVINATKLYLRSTDSRFIMFPHYFLYKGVGASQTSTIRSWLDEYKDSQVVGNVSTRRRLQ